MHDRTYDLTSQAINMLLQQSQAHGCYRGSCTQSMMFGEGTEEGTARAEGAPAHLLAGVACIAGGKVEDAAAGSHQLPKSEAEAFSHETLQPACMHP